ncbi:MAG TPA: putative sulfate exporter family transporter [Planctomycetota bacterium]|jgi:uncharacterized membrane protein YadS
MAEKKQTMLSSEDWWSVWIGLAIFALSLGVFAGIDLLGWSAKASPWLAVGSSIKPVSAKYAQIPSWASILLTYVFLLGICSFGARFLGANVKRFALSFSAVFWISFLCWVAGHYAYIAATSNQLGKMGITWSLNLTGEAGLVIALIAGLTIGNFFPRFAAKLTEAARPEWYIKTAIVILGAGLGAKAAQATGLASAVMFRGACAVIEAYLIYWALVYFIARRFFGFSREWAAPLASGVSICGVSAAIATGAAIRARPVIPIIVSSLVVIFAVMELLILPFVAQHMMYQEPMVAGAWMGLAVKTDGAAVASGAITDSLICAKAAAEQGIHYKEGWMLMTTTTTKMFIDVFIGVWSFVLSIIWCTRIEPKTEGRIGFSHLWDRFPKFVIGYFITFLVLVLVCLFRPSLKGACTQVTEEGNVFRVLFFAMTFFTIGLVSNFKKLWEEGVGKLVAVYVISLFGFILWIGLAISWIFFHGIKPPLAGN